MGVMQHTLIRGGRVIDPASGLDALADVLVHGSTIASIGEQVDAPEGAAVIDAEGCIVAPGLVDIHVHLRDPDTSGHHEETIETGTRAAASGGFSTVCCMPNTTPATDSPEVVDAILLRALEAQYARVFPVACGTLGRKGETLAPIHSLIQAGAVGISDDGDGIADSGVMAAVLKQVADCNSVFMQHCQEPTLTRGAAMNAGPLATRLGVGGWPSEAEEIMLRRDIVLNRRIGARYHAQHMTTAVAMEAIREARADGQPVTGEASPHHLLLTEDECDNWNTQAKVNPPLRTAADVQALREAVADGTITVLATDHAPHPAQSKAVDFQSASFGMSSIEICLPLYREALIDSGVIDWPRMIAMMTIEGALLTGLDTIGLGRLSAGGPADVTIIDPDTQWAVDPATFLSMGRNTPFAGRPLRGRALATFSGGRMTWNLLGDRAAAGIESMA